jgi:Nidogen-like
MLPGKYQDDPPVNPAISNSFQAMMAWDAKRTFACFFYPQGGIQWAQAATMMGPAAVVRTRAAFLLDAQEGGGGASCMPC